MSEMPQRSTVWPARLRRSSRPLVLATILTAAATACGDSSAPSAISFSDLVGTWQLKAWVYSLAAKPDSTVDWVRFRALTGSLVIAANDSFTVTPMLPGGFAHDYGTLTLDADSLYWDGQNDEEWIRLTLSGSQLTLDWPETEFVDMDQDGQPEDANLRVVFGRS